MPSARVDKCSQSRCMIMGPNLVSTPKFLKKRPKGTDTTPYHGRLVQ
ncbi:unnamed protein product [Gulo gulo]|uniref:Uncharacterized protein n=1 Tax=Gulo gulo TaxID=48420 RepID=A0A9X9LJB0_GULGU|nr:unnamed protein product [Gulo gulo]